MITKISPYKLTQSSNSRNSNSPCYASKIQTARADSFTGKAELRDAVPKVLGSLSSQNFSEISEAFLSPIPYPISLNELNLIARKAKKGVQIGVYYTHHRGGGYIPIVNGTANDLAALKPSDLVNTITEKLSNTLDNI